MPRAAITLSTSDPAGATMLKIFRDLGFNETSEASILARGDTYLIPVEPLIVPPDQYKTPASPSPYPADYDSISRRLAVDYIVVASRHWAKSGQPSLTVHATGNYGKAVYGGRPRELQRVPANPMRDVYNALLQSPPPGFQVSLEATHHSPTSFSTPMFFAEVGSSERQWVDEAACRYLSESILSGIEKGSSTQTAIGFGGGHYCPTFTPMEKETAFGHIAAKYAIPELTEETMAQMIDKTLPKPSTAYIESSVKGFERKRIQVALRNLDLELKEA